MRKIGWATDLHLDFASADQRNGLLQQFHAQRLDCLLIAGDIAESKRYKEELLWLYENLQIPLYFVLGNHDFYGSFIKDVRQDAAHFCQLKTRRLCYLTAQPSCISLTEQWGLIGHDGWSDGRAGDYENSTVELRDFQEIEDLRSLSKEKRLTVLHRLGLESALQVEKQLAEAFKNYEQVLLLTHAPPFIEACLYDNHIADARWAPLFVNQVLGESLLNLMNRYKKKSLLVLCGHTHHAATYQPLSNLKVLVGQARYGQPSSQPPLLIDETGRLSIEQAIDARLL